MPVACHGDSLAVAFGEPEPDVGVIDELFAVLCGGESETRELQILVADAWQVSYYIHKIYGHPDDHVD